MTRKKYFIPLSSLNLNGIFSSESVSPHSFYEKRMFGVPYNILTDDNGTLLQTKNSLVLFPNYFDFLPSEGSPIFLGVYEDDLDKNVLVKDSEANIAYYFKSIYLRKGNFFVLFSNSEEKDLFIAMAAPSTEVKTLNKYNTKFRFGGKEIDILYSHPRKDQYKECTYISIKSLEIDNQAFFFDKAFNHIKGFIYGFLCGSLGQKTDDEIKLENTFQELHNLITGIKGKIEIRQSFNVNDYDEFEKELKKSSLLFDLVFPETQTFNYKNISVRLVEIIKLQEKRYKELHRQSQNTTGSKEFKITTQMQIDELKTQFDSIYKKEQQLRSRNKKLKGEKPKRPKADSPEKVERERVENEIEEIKFEILDLKKKKEKLKRQISNLEIDLREVSTVGITEYDNSVEEQYYKIAEYITNLAFLVSKLLSENKRKSVYPQINEITFDIVELTNNWKKKSNKCSNFITSFKATSIDNLKGFDLSLYKICVNVLLKNSKTDNNNLNAKSTDLAIYLLEYFKESDLVKTEEGNNVRTNLENLIEYRSNRTDDYNFPENQILKAFVCMIFKSSSIIDFTDLIQSNKVNCLDIAYSFWATFNGFANLPKNLTDIIFENGNEQLLTYIDSYLFDNYLKSIE